MAEFVSSTVNKLKYVRDNVGSFPPILKIIYSCANCGSKIQFEHTIGGPEGGFQEIILGGFFNYRREKLDMSPCRCGGLLTYHSYIIAYKVGCPLKKILRVVYKKGKNTIIEDYPSGIFKSSEEDYGSRLEDIPISLDLDKIMSEGQWEKS